MNFIELPHTADVKIRASASTLDDLFGEACMAMMQVMFGSDRKSGGVFRSVDLTSMDTESLLLDFLSEVLYVSEVDGLVFARAAVTIDGQHLHAILDGELFDPTRHNTGTGVKGISYSGLLIRQYANGYMLEIVFDV
jgi:SHS2 domain-containing protein